MNYRSITNLSSCKRGLISKFLATFLLSLSLLILISSNSKAQDPVEGCYIYGYYAELVSKFYFNNGAIDYSNTNMSSPVYQNLVGTYNADVTPGEKYEFNGVTGYYYGDFYDHMFTVYVDWNKDSYFTGTSEVILQTYTGWPDGKFSGTLTVPTWVSPGVYRMRLTTSEYYWDCSSYPGVCYGCGYMGYWCNAVDFKLTVKTGVDAAMIAITQPSAPFYSGTYNVAATMKSLGKKDITKATIYWWVNGVQQPTYNWTGTLTQNSTTTIPLGSYNFSYPPNGPFNPFAIDVQVFAPNGFNPDDDPSNDKISGSVAPIRDDAGAVAVVGPPDVFAPGPQTITITVKNYGARPLSSVTAIAVIDGTSISNTVTFNPPLYTGETRDVTIGTYNLPLKSPLLTYTFEAKTSRPNNATDENPSNDSYYTFKAPALTPGDYYISYTNPTDHFPSIDAACTYLKAAGIFKVDQRTEVNFWIRPGVYNSQLDLGGFSSVGCNINFQSTSGNAPDVVISASPSQSENYVWNLYNANSINFKNLTFTNSNNNQSNAGRIFNINNLQQVKFEKCVFNGVQAPYCFHHSNPAFDLITIKDINYFSFINNTVRFGSYGIYLTNNNVNPTVLITNNDFYSFYCGGIYAQSNNTQINSNKLSGNNAKFGIWVDGFKEIKGNEISGLDATGVIHNDLSGIRASNWNYETTVPIIANNNIMGATYVNGIYYEGVSSDISNNNISIMANGPYAGILLSRAGLAGYEVKLNKNDVTARNGYGLNLYSSYVKAFYNKFVSSNDNGTAYAGFYAQNSGGYVAENMIVGLKGNGIYLNGSEDMQLYYNSVNSRSTGTNNGALYLDKASNITMKRNLFNNMGTGNYCIIANNMSAGSFISDQNNFWPNSTVTGSYLARWNGVNKGNLADWQATTGGDANSASLNIPFVSDIDLHLTLFDEKITQKNPLFAQGTWQHNAFELVDWDGEDRTIYYFGVDHIIPKVTIIKQPESIEGCMGSTGNTLTVISEVSYGGRSLYQWYKDGEVIEGGNDAILYLPPLDYTNAGVYWCIVSGTGDAAPVPTDQVMVRVTENTKITRQPQTAYLNLGEVARFDFDAQISVSQEPQYQPTVQWYRGGIALKNNDRIAGANSSILSIRNIDAGDYGDDYYVVVKGLCGTVQSDNFGIALPPGINIVKGPDNTLTCPGQKDVQFSVEAVATGGGKELKYRWYKDGVMLRTSEKYSGVVTNTLTVYNIDANDVGNYECEITVLPTEAKKMAGPAALALLKPVSIKEIKPGIEVDIEKDKELRLEVVTEGDAPINYQWYKDGVEIPNATDAVYLVANAQDTDAGKYTCKVSNICNEVISNEISVTVTMQNILMGIEEDNINGFTLYTNNPNPFNSSTDISFYVPYTSNIKLSVTDVFGKEVVVLANGVFQNGLHSVKFDAQAHNLSSGIYYYTLTASSISITKQMVIIK